MLGFLPVSSYPQQFPGDPFRSQVENLFLKTQIFINNENVLKMPSCWWESPKAAF